jgi:hypothetical protein
MMHKKDKPHAFDLNTEVLLLSDVDLERCDALTRAA